MTSPPQTSRASASSTFGTHSASFIVGSAVSSSTPSDFQPSSHMGLGAVPLMNRYAIPAGSRVPYDAVGMQSALASAIGLPSSATSAFSMLELLMPAEARRSFTDIPSRVVWTGYVRHETSRTRETHRAG